MISRPASNILSFWNLELGLHSPHHPQPVFHVPCSCLDDPLNPTSESSTALFLWQIAWTGLSPTSVLVVGLLLWRDLTRQLIQKKHLIESLLPVWEGVNHCDDRKQRQTGHGIGFWNVKAHLQQHTSSNKTIPLNLSNSSKYSNMSLLGSFSIKPPHRVSSFETAILSFWRPGDSYDIEVLCHRKAEGKSTFSQWNWLPLW